MKFILFLVLGFHLFAGSVDAETALITLDNGFTWKAMFDAGLRPSHIGEGTYGCRQMNVHVKIRKQEGGEILDLGTGDVEFSLREGHLLDLVAFYGREYRAVGEVEEKSNVFSRIFGSAVRQKAQIAWFEVKHTVDYSGRKIDPPEITRQVDDKNATNGAKIGDLSIVYSFRSANSREKPMVERLSIALRSREAMRGRPLRTKIESPPGYEHVSLEPVLAAPANLEPEPTPARKPVPAPPVPAAAPAAAPQPAPVAQNPAPAVERKSAVLPWLVGITVLVVIVIVALKRRA